MLSVVSEEALQPSLDHADLLGSNTGKYERRPSQQYRQDDCFQRILKVIGYEIPPASRVCPFTLTSMDCPDAAASSKAPSETSRLVKLLADDGDVPECFSS